MTTTPTQKSTKDVGFNIYKGFIECQVSVQGDWHLPTLQSDTQNNPDADTLVAEPEVAEPPMYHVVMFNDNYTPMEFVVWVLQSEFKHTVERAVEIMLTIHHKGQGVAGTFPKDIAETKAKSVNALARQEGYPLLTQIEPSR